MAHDQSTTEITVKYSIFSSNENGAFSIDSNTGETETFNAHSTILVLTLVIEHKSNNN